MGESLSGMPGELIAGAVITTTRGLTRHWLRRWDLMPLSTGGRAATALCGVVAGDQEAVTGHARALVGEASDRYAVALRAFLTRRSAHCSSVRAIHYAERRLNRVIPYALVSVDALPPCPECDAAAGVFAGED